MGLAASIEPYILKFKKPATTSRGAFEDRTIWVLKIWNKRQPKIIGMGECAPLKGLSIDDKPDYFQKLENLVKAINLGKNIADYKFNLNLYPSIKFGLETALLDLKNGGNQIIFNNFYAIGKQGLPINGLVWMSDFEDMKAEAIQKIENGFDCIKLKVGAIEFDKELELLKIIRAHPKGKDILLRLDANGAFLPSNALQKLTQLAAYNIHSIEQPIKQSQWEEMKQLIAKSPIAIALDEELIGVDLEKDMEVLLKTIAPNYIVLKPNLLGGFVKTEQWIRLAERLNIGWWLTSALEGNIGLNAIAQFAASVHPKLHSGLGTGKLYANNLTPNTRINEGILWRDIGHKISD